MAKILRIIPLFLLLTACSTLWAFEFPLGQWYPLFHEMAQEKKFNWSKMAFIKGKEHDEVILEAQARLYEFTPFILATGKSVNLKRIPNGRALHAKTKFQFFGEKTIYENPKEALAAALASLQGLTKISLTGPVEGTLSLQTTLQGVPPLRALPKLIEGSCTSLTALRKGAIEIITINFSFPLKKGPQSTKDKNHVALAKVLPQASMNEADGELTFKALLPATAGQRVFLDLAGLLDLKQMSELSLTYDGSGARFAGKLINP